MIMRMTAPSVAATRGLIQLALPMGTRGIIANSSSALNLDSQKPCTRFISTLSMSSQPEITLSNALGSADTSLSCQSPTLASMPAISNRSPGTSLQRIQAFHSTSKMAFRRRRRGGAAPVSESESNDDNSSENSQFVKDPQVFRQQGKILLDKIYQALQPLRKANTTFILLRGRNPSIPGEYVTLDLGKDVIEEHFQILVDMDKNLLVYSSPVSGQYVYHCKLPAGDVPRIAAGTKPSAAAIAAAAPEWVSIQDGHSFEGMFVRDYIRVGKGAPKL